MLAKNLEAANLRHRVLAQNIANINTPGYQRLEVSFEDALARQIDKAKEAGAKSVIPKVVEGSADASRADGNNVDVDKELGRLTKNTLLMNAWTQILASKLAGMRTAISGR